MIEKYNKLGALFLAVVMTLSLVAMGATAIGTTAAQTEEPVTITVDAELDAEPGEETTVSFWVSEEESGTVLDTEDYVVGPEETETGEVTLTADFENDDLEPGDGLPVTAVVSDGNMNFINPAPDFSIDDAQPGDEYDMTGAFQFELGSPDNLEITEYDISETNVDVGDSLDAEATVVNEGDEAGSMDVELTVDGDTVDTENVDVFPGDTVTANLTWIADEEGEYEVTVGDLDPTTVTVGDGDERSLADYANEDGIVETGGLLDAISEWQDGTIETIFLLEVIGAWQTGEPVE